MQAIIRLQDDQERDYRDAATVANSLQKAKENIADVVESMNNLNNLRTQITNFVSSPNEQHIGFVLHADPISALKDSDRFTIDWAVIKLNEDAFDWRNFRGNQIYTRTRSRRVNTAASCTPALRTGLTTRSRRMGMLQIFGLVPENEIRFPEQLVSHGDKAMPVIKHGMTTGTTVGWINGLQSAV